MRSGTIFIVHVGTGMLTKAAFPFHDHQTIANWNAMQAEPNEKKRATITELPLNAIISDQVIQLLGQPGDLHAVQVRKLWDEHYRVNVFIGADPSSIQITDCFFLVTDSGGKILNSSPKITKRY